MHAAGRRKAHDASVINDDNDDGEGAQQIEAGLAFAILKAWIDCRLRHKFNQETRNPGEELDRINSINTIQEMRK